jgi:PqqD family protein of HPr-rel-A system
MARYRAADPATLRIVPLDILTAIYHRRSGQTHLVESPVPEILSMLAAAPLDAATLLAALSVEYDLQDPDVDALTARLDELCDAGLIVAA